MKRKIITGIIAFVVICVVIGLAWSSNIIAAGHEEEKHSKEELVNLIAEAKDTKINAHTMADSARKLGWEEDSKLIKELQETWANADADEKQYQKELDIILSDEAEAARKAEEERIAAEKAAKEAEEKRIAEAKAAEEAKWATKAAQYPAATQIWRYMKALGWNDYVCAGIMGNLMAEVGGQTLDIRYTLSSGSYYGMCQWSRGYSAVWGAGLETQCDFLRDTIKYEFDTYGFKYQKGFNFNSFLNMTDAQQAALAFAKAYERCGSGSYGVRQSNALKAYNYFVG